MKILHYRFCSAHKSIYSIYYKGHRIVSSGVKTSRNNSSKCGIPGSPVHACSLNDSKKEYNNGFKEQILTTKMESENKLFSHIERQVKHPRFKNIPIHVSISRCYFPKNSRSLALIKFQSKRRRSNSSILQLCTSRHSERYTGPGSKLDAKLIVETSLMAQQAHLAYSKAMVARCVESTARFGFVSSPAFVLL